MSLVFGHLIVHSSPSLGGFIPRGVFQSILYIYLTRTIYNGDENRKGQSFFYIAAKTHRSRSDSIKAFSSIV